MPVGRPRIAAVLAGAALALGLTPVAQAQQVVPVEARLTCVAPTDAGTLDRMLGAAGSPLAGQGGTFVSEATAVGLDPRFLVAIAAHETLLETYLPAQLIRNPFGLGPGLTYDSEADAIGTAARVLAGGYLAEGRTTIDAIGAKWAPLGVANDPTALNQHWPGGVSRYYAALGGDPSRTVLLADQNPLPSCGPVPAFGAPGSTLTPAEAIAAGPPLVTVWGGATPRVASPRPEAGADPRTGAPATLEGFVFPLALPAGGPARFADGFRDPGPLGCHDQEWRCSILLESAPGTPAVAAIAGTLRIASAAEQEDGVAFWIQGSGEDRVGYGPLAAYSAGIAEGVEVEPGTPLGATAGRLRVAWERGGARVNPFPLLAVTRPPA
ncbi:MAG: hypothetical protein QOD86_401 [Miltoncostaeaceae bacterium]|jgi:hypothetical protein|nr:hypothetical protein [Miltoncostaeaceae bacterium]